MGAQDAHRGAQKTSCCMCFDISNALSQGRRRYVEPYCDRRRDMGAPFLGGKRFDDEDDLEDAVQKWLTSQAAAFYEEGIQKLVLRYDKCLTNGGEYVEK